MPGFARFGRPSKPLAVAVGIVLLLIAAWVVVAQLGANHGDRYESFYPSLAEADKDGAINRGWVPDDLLPRSSRAIHEVHDLSPSTEWCVFEFDPADSQRLRENLKTVDVIPVPVRRVPNPDVSWWPSMLKGDLDTETIHKEKFELYTVERPETSVTTEILLFAIDWSNGRGFFYSTSE
ncbi:MAG: hypothetical protein JWO71_4795 [Candidatus Acidoferrum typicum]|nr:hypothetical protein [Candidatus Acidoferrum typicum]MCU1270502.1 hypothetical protein [Acidobacteriaceae bacterium]